MTLTVKVDPEHFSVIKTERDDSDPSRRIVLYTPGADLQQTIQKLAKKGLTLTEPKGKRVDIIGEDEQDLIIRHVVPLANGVPTEELIEVTADENGINLECELPCYAKRGVDGILWLVFVKGEHCRPKLLGLWNEGLAVGGLPLPVVHCEEKEDGSAGQPFLMMLDDLVVYKRAIVRKGTPNALNPDEAMRDML